MRECKVPEHKSNTYIQPKINIIYMKRGRTQQLQLRRNWINISSENDQMILLDILCPRIHSCVCV